MSRRVPTCSLSTIQDGCSSSRTPVGPCGALSHSTDRWYTPRVVVGASLSVPHPAALDILLISCWILVVEGRRVLFVDAAPHGTLALGPTFFFRPPDSASSLSLLSGSRTMISLGFIPLTTSLPEGSRLSRLRRGQRFGWRCQKAGQLGEIPCDRISKKSFQKYGHVIAVKDPHVISGMRPSGPNAPKMSNCGSGGPGC